MKLEIRNNEILVWETGRKNNSLLYQTGCDLSRINRENLCLIYDFLLGNEQYAEAQIVQEKIGKVLRYKDIPKLTPVSDYKIDVGLSFLEEQISSFVKDYNLDLNPDFQRDHVWNLDQRTAFVEFIAQGGVANHVYLNHTQWSTGIGGEFVIVDGKQRLTSLLMFVKNKLPIFKGLDKDGIGYYFKELDLMRHKISIIVNDLPTRKQVLQWYLQLNKGNVAHSKEEIEKVEKLLDKELLKNESF